jgi:hypothetical protein
MNTIQIQAFVNALKKTKKVLNEKRIHVDETIISDSGNIGIIGVSNFKQNQIRNETINVRQSNVEK